jgi:hypothetical protein
MSGVSAETDGRLFTSAARRCSSDSGAGAPMCPFTAGSSDRRGDAGTRSDQTVAESDEIVGPPGTGALVGAGTSVPGAAVAVSSVAGVSMPVLSPLVVLLSPDCCGDWSAWPGVLVPCGVSRETSARPSCPYAGTSGGAWASRGSVAGTTLMVSRETGPATGDTLDSPATASPWVTPASMDRPLASGAGVGSM